MKNKTKSIEQLLNNQTKTILVAVDKKMDEKFGVFDRQTRRSITPAGFAQAFYKANQ